MNDNINAVPMENKQNSSDSHEIEETLGDEIYSFIDGIDAIKDTINPSIEILEDKFKNSAQQMNELLKTKFIIQEDGREAVKINLEDQYELVELLNQLRKNSLALEIIPKSLFIALVSQYDAFLKKFLEMIFSKRPELIDDGCNNINYAELLEIGSIESARKLIIEKYTENLLRKSHIEQLKSLSQKFKVTLESEPFFTELTERRNILTHTKGEPSKHYYDMCKSVGIEIAQEDLPRKPLVVSLDYFTKSHSCLYKMGIKIAQVLWRKLLPKESEQADNNLISVSYRLLCEENYDLACKILDFAFIPAIMKNYSKGNALILLVNIAQAYKWSGKPDKVKEILTSESDWSAYANQFKLAYSVLNDDWIKAAEVMREIGKDIKFRSYYKIWPLFKSFRMQKIFASTYNEIYGDEVSLSSCESSDLAKLID